MTSLSEWLGGACVAAVCDRGSQSPHRVNADARHGYTNDFCQSPAFAGKGTNTLPRDRNYPIRAAVRPVISH